MRHLLFFRTTGGSRAATIAWKRVNKRRMKRREKCGLKGNGKREMGNGKGKEDRDEVRWVQAEIDVQSVQSHPTLSNFASSFSTKMAPHLERSSRLYASDWLSTTDLRPLCCSTSRSTALPQVSFHSQFALTSSKTFFKPFWVKAEHSTYLTAPSSLANLSPASTVTGLCFCLLSFSLTAWSSLKSTWVPTIKHGTPGQWWWTSGNHFSFTFSKEAGEVTEKQTRKTSVWG